MTLTSEQSFQPARPETTLPDVTLQVRDGAKDAVRLVKRFVGACLAFAALSLLLLPFGGTSTAEVLSKLMVALVLGFVGMALWQSGTRQPIPDIEVDMESREVRFVQVSDGQRHVIHRRRFADLARAEIEGDHIQLWEKDDNLLAELTVSDEMGLRALRRALTDEGLVFDKAA